MRQRSFYDSITLADHDEALDEWTRGKRKWVNGWNKTVFTTDGHHDHFAEWCERDTEEMVRRDRNHPSIVMWSIGNEIDYPDDPYPPNSPELTPIAAKLADVVRRLDATRPVTAAMAAPETCLFADMLDIAGYNYKENLYDAHREAFPARIIYGSENFHTHDAWRAVRDNDHIFAQFLWTGIDFLGEAGPWPNRGSCCGLLDIAGFQKPGYFRRQAWWSHTPMVFIHEHDGAIVCYSNCAAVRLAQNARVVGEQAVPDNGTLSWPVRLADGDITATGMVNGSAACSFSLRRAGAPARLAATVDGTVDDTPGGVTHVVVTIVDQAGVVVPDAAQRIGCTVAGPGTILGIENGDQNDTEPYDRSCRRAHRGRLLIYVHAPRTPERIVITATAEGLEETTIAI